MRGKIAKQIRKLTANPSLPERTYEHKVVKETVVGKRLTWTFKEVPIVHEHIMTVLGNCQRLHYQRMKDNYKRMARGDSFKPLYQ